MLSFIVPAHNEEQLLGQTLSSIHGAARRVGEPYEVVVVDDASTDETGAIAARLGARVLRVNNRQIAATRNAGAAAARGEVFFFVDADTLASAAAVRAAVTALRRGAVGGGFVSRFDRRLPLWARLVFPAGVLGQRLLKIVGGCFLFCTRQAFRNAGGFCERYFAAEETAFVAALKRQGRFVIPPGYVVTSGRKFGVLSARQAIGLLIRLAAGGPESFRRREGLEIWYGPRQDGPGRPAVIKEATR
jgi:glycosyltransferase involved in cell wall biosynthesis